MAEDANRSTTRILVAVIVVAAVVLVALIVAATVLRGGSDDEPPVTATSPTTTTSSVPSVPPTSSSTTTEEPRVRVQDHVVPAGLIQREYLTVTPLDVRSGERLPVVVALHGLGVDRSAMLNAADWRGAVERDRFVAVFPQGIANSWNMGPCCPPANLLGTDDLAYLDTVLAEVTARPEVDAARSYLTGFSNGGVMAYWVACSRPDDYVSVAPMAGSNLTGCHPDRPMSLLHQHSDPDPVVPYDGLPTLTQLLSSADFPDVPTSTAAWAEANGCAATPEEAELGSGIERTEWSGCDDGTVVELVRIPGRGHQWPEVGDYDGLDEMLRFFDLTS